MPGPFYIAWSPGLPDFAPVRRSSHKAAKYDAWQLAEQHPGREFFVLKKKGQSAMIDPLGPGPSLNRRCRTDG